MPADLNILQFFLVSQFADLEGVTGGYDQRKSTVTELVYDWLEERNVRRVVQIDPNLWLAISR